MIGWLMPEGHWLIVTSQKHKILEAPIKLLTGNGDIWSDIQSMADGSGRSRSIEGASDVKGPETANDPIYKTLLMIPPQNYILWAIFYIKISKKSRMNCTNLSKWEFLFGYLENQNLKSWDFYMIINFNFWYQSEL